MYAASFFADLGLSALAVLAVSLLALLCSSYVKLVTVLGIVRLGLGANSLPSAFVTGGLALALSFFVMYPTLNRAAGEMDKVLQGSGANVNDQVRARAFAAGLEQWRSFLVKHSHEKELERFGNLAKQIDSTAATRRALKGKTSSSELGSWRIVTPAFLVSELKEAFATGLSLLLPFLVIDLLVANVLVAVGLERLNPDSISLPFKLLLFVMVDGWGLITGNLVATYAV